MVGSISAPGDAHGVARGPARRHRLHLRAQLPEAGPKAMPRYITY